MPYRASDRKFIEFSNIKWIILLSMELVGAIFFLFFKRVKGSNTFSCCLIDSICLIAMFIIYKINEAASIKPEDNK